MSYESYSLEELRELFINAGVRIAHLDAAIEASEREQNRLSDELDVLRAREWIATDRRAGKGFEKYRRKASRSMSEDELVVGYVRTNHSGVLYSTMNDHPLNYARLREMQMATAMTREIIDLQNTHRAIETELRVRGLQP